MDALLDASCGSVERVLHDVNILMQKYDQLENEIKKKQQLLLDSSEEGIKIDKGKGSGDDTIHIPYKNLHYIISERNFLMTNYTVVKEALGSSDTTNTWKTRVSPTAKKVSLINSSSAYQETEDNRIFINTSIDEVITKFSPSDRKSISEHTRTQARKFIKDFTRLDLCAELPSMTIEPLNGGINGVSTMKGPGHSSADIQKFANFCCCRTISTYPVKENYHQRMGDPICDRYFVRLYENRIITALADGCSWGERSRSAAKKACKEFILYMNKKQKSPKNLQELGKVMLEAFAEANVKILESSNDAIDTAGTTTLNGSVLLRASPGDSTLYKWVFVSCNLGDCKAYYYSKQSKKIHDVTHNTRLNIQDSGDPGGRLGPQGNDTLRPDLRNLNLFWQYCEEGDFIIIVSDGVYDNCDLRHQGYKPSDVGLSGDSWYDVDQKKLVAIDANHVEEQLSNIINSIGDEVTPDKICIAITDFCAQMTEASRTFMADNPHSRLPKDYAKYPGKVDHTSVLCYKIGEVTLSYDQWMGK